MISCCIIGIYSSWVCAAAALNSLKGSPCSCIILQFAGFLLELTLAFFSYKEIELKTALKNSDNLTTALILLVKTFPPWPNCCSRRLLLHVQWYNDCLLSLKYCFCCHFLILVYGPRCWRRGANPQKRQFRAVSDVLCGGIAALTAKTDSSS